MTRYSEIKSFRRHFRNLITKNKRIPGGNKISKWRLFRKQLKSIKNYQKWFGEVDAFSKK